MIPRDQLHFTLKFLGEVKDSQVNKVSSLISTVSSPSFDITLKGVGVFPSLSEPRVVWVGVDKNGGLLSDLANGLNSLLSSFRREERLFHPHLTFARVKSPSQVLTDFVKNNKNVSLGSCFIDSIVLYSSRLTPFGPIYNVVSKHKL